jgi:Holliday junction resolvase RusA-like endonuclease
MLTFSIPCIPPKSTHQASAQIMRKKERLPDGTIKIRQFVGKSDSSKGARVKQDLVNLLRPYAPPTPFVGPVKLSVIWSYPWRKAETKKNRAKGYLPCDTRPDVDNIIKLVLDVMTLLRFWTDDNQVADIRIQKRWGDWTGIAVAVRMFDERDG